MTAVGRVAGVSRSAVSLALANHPSIPPSTRERILAAARQLGYRPNPLVSALMVERGSKARAAPAAVLAFLSSERGPYRTFVERTFAHAQRRAGELGFKLEDFPLNAPTMGPARLNAVLQSRGIHGVLVGPLYAAESALAFDVSNFAAVGLGLSVQTPFIFRVAADHFWEMQLAFRRLRALGYRRIGFALPRPISERLENRWLGGFLFAQSAVAIRERTAPWLPSSEDELRTELRKWIKSERIDAVIHAGPSASLAGAPLHVGLVGLSIPPAGSVLAGISQNEARIATAAVEQLVARLHHWTPGPQDLSDLLLVQGAWIDGPTAPGAGSKRPPLPANQAGAGSSRPSHSLSSLR